MCHIKSTSIIKTTLTPKQAEYIKKLCNLIGNAHTT